MNILLIALAVIAVLCLIFGFSLGQAVTWLVYVGVILLVIALIVYLVNFLTGRRRTL
jgi:hypothetical protein